MNVRMLCQGCAREGVQVFGSLGRPRWCRCRGRSFGPIVAAPGTIVRLAFDTPERAVLRERCRVLGNAERRARDRLSERWVRCGRGWRELPPSSRRRRALESAYRDALLEFERARSECEHPERSVFAPGLCGICYASVGDVRGEEIGA